jgi:acetate kinase
LVMGTRSGDIDPSLIEFLMIKEGMSISEVDTLLNKQSGLLGISGLTSDMRELLEEETENQDRRARLAIDIFCRRVKQYIGSYLAEMETGAEAIVFSGGIGENSAAIRSRICDGLGSCGIELDEETNKNPGDAMKISAYSSRIAAYVIPTNEDLLIARDTYRVVADVPRRW